MAQKRMGPEDERMTVDRPERTELLFLIGGLILVALLLGFAQLSNEVVEGETQHFDEQVLKSLRRADDPSMPIGPRWLQLVALDITSLGSGTVLGLAVVAIAGFLLLQGMFRTAALIVAASAGGWILNWWLKAFFQRPRPEVVPHLRDVFSLSFPSGHAMTSAVVYLTLGALLMRIAERRATKIYCMAAAVVVTFLVGSSRIYLGVHYPTDVLAGWLVGLSWALFCWLIERALERRTGLRREVHAGQH
jgi:undecaprenyl-diphosphatase